MRLTAEVLVVGGGIAGTVAAIAAGRAGADTLLVERWGFLGGAATAAAVGQFVGWETASGRRVVAGIAEEIVERLVALGASDGHARFTMSTGHVMDRVSYDPELLKVVLDRLVTEAGVKLLFHTALLDVTRTGETITQVQLLTKAGAVHCAPRVVVGRLRRPRSAGARRLPLPAARRGRDDAARHRDVPLWPG